MNNLKILKYPSINGLRALSISLVVIHHLFYKKYIFVGFEKFILFRPFYYILENGQLGVNIFFVISGFLITSLMLNEENARGFFSIKNFYIRRTLRIFPAYYFLLLVYFILQKFQVIYISNSSWLTALTYTKYINYRLDWVTAHAWSLSIEEQFYIIWPLIFFYGYKFRKQATFFLILIVPIFRILLFINPVDWINELSIFTRIDAIATGCLFAFYKDIIIEKVKKYWNALFFLSIATIFFITYFKILLDITGFGYIIIPFGTTNGTIANFAISIIIFYSIFGPKNLWFKFLNFKILNYIGLLSYSIYLWQQIFISGDNSWFSKYPQNLIFILIISIFSYHIIEKPLLSLKTKFTGLKTNAIETTELHHLEKKL